jgi:hypothetical protein
MMLNRTLAALTIGLALVAVACEEKKENPSSASSASASASASPSASASASAAPSSTGVASAAPSSSSGSSMITGDAKDVVLTVKDPKAQPDMSIKAAPGGSVTVFLPDYAGTVWSVTTVDKTLGKPKEEVIPGFAPGTSGHQFKWTTTGPLIKSGEKHRVELGNKKVGDKTGKPTVTFTLTIEIT